MPKKGQKIGACDGRADLFLDLGLNAFLNAFGPCVAVQRSAFPPLYAIEPRLVRAECVPYRSVVYRMCSLAIEHLHPSKRCLMPPPLLLEPRLVCSLVSYDDVTYDVTCMMM